MTGLLLLQIDYLGQTPTGMRLLGCDPLSGASTSIEVSIGCDPERWLSAAAASGVEVLAASGLHASLMVAEDTREEVSS